METYEDDETTIHDTSNDEIIVVNQRMTNFSQEVFMRTFGENILQRDMKKDLPQGKFHKLEELDHQETCEVCNRQFNNLTNFDWSCVYHPFQWNGFIYRCCGKTKKQSPGCSTSKHKKTQTPKPPQIFFSCTSCKDHGHTSKDCPKDPNTRTGVDPFSELNRISQLNFSKMTPKIKSAKYELEREGFNDIKDLQKLIKEKQLSQNRKF
ncbi:hypothetical protein SteCoe_28866 [Stentor coeruleus]|uniref:CCHC-type domain-containing protein n=1 Tax=Stentor coeruleus TaxID=5963 RepID=A0A1R2B796_9CILI|nr:hypothetical protein SteCoe_28866 [Stentor coeruleus]